MKKFILSFLVLTATLLSQNWHNVPGIYGGNIISAAKLNDTMFIAGKNIFSSNKPVIKWNFSYSGSVIKQIFINPKNPKIVYASDYCEPCVITDVRKTTDGGLYWETKESLVGEGDIFYNSNNDYLYAFANKKLSYSKGGNGWEDLTFPVIYLNDLAFNEDETIFAAADSLYISNDNGGKWRGLIKLTNKYVTYGNGILFADNKLSHNNGITWIDINITPKIEKVFYAGNNIYYANTTSGIFKSTNDGLDWTGIHSTGKVLVAEADTIYYKNGKSGLSKMNTVTLQTKFENNGYFDGTEFSIKSDNSKAYLKYYDIIYESSIHSNNWVPVLTGNLTGDFVVDYQHRVIVSAKDSIYYKSTFGTEWKTIPAAKTYKKILFTGDSALFYISTDNYLYKSESITAPMVELGYIGNASVTSAPGGTFFYLVRNDSLYYTDDQFQTLTLRKVLPFNNAGIFGHHEMRTVMMYRLENTDGMYGLAFYNKFNNSIKVIDTLIRSATLTESLQLYFIKNREVYSVYSDDEIVFIQNDFNTTIYSANSTLRQLFIFVEDLGIYSLWIPSDVNDSNVLNTFNLEQNYPNPFNPATTINYTVPKAGNIKLAVYDLLGREIITLVDEYKTGGSYNVQLNGKGLSSGTYFYKLTVDGQSTVKKMILAK